MHREPLGSPHVPPKGSPLPGRWVEPRGAPEQLLAPAPRRGSAARRHVAPPSVGLTVTPERTALVNVHVDVPSEVRTGSGEWRERARC